MSATDQLQALLERHCASLDDEIGSIGRKLSAAMLAREQCSGMMQETIALVHTVNGSSGSLGFHVLSAVAAKLEDFLNGIARSGSRPDEADIRRAYEIFTEMQKAAAETMPEDSHLFGVDLANPEQVSRPRREVV